MQLKEILFNKKLIGIVAFAQQKSKYAKMLKSIGFIANPFKKGPLSEKTPFIFFSEKEIIKKYNDPAKWQINSFDHDAL